MPSFTTAVLVDERWYKNWDQRKSLAAAMSYARHRLTWPGAQKVFIRQGQKAWLMDAEGVRRVPADLIDPPPGVEDSYLGKVFVTVHSAFPPGDEQRATV